MHYHYLYIPCNIRRTSTEEVIGLFTVQISHTNISSASDYVYWSWSASTKAGMVV